MAHQGARSLERFDKKNMRVMLLTVRKSLPNVKYERPPRCLNPPKMYRAHYNTTEIEITETEYVHMVLLAVIYSKK